MAKKRRKQDRASLATHRLLWAWLIASVAMYASAVITWYFSTGFAFVSISAFAPPFLSPLLSPVLDRVPTVLGFLLAAKVSDRQRQRHLLLDLGIIAATFLIGFIQFAKFSPSAPISSLLWTVIQGALRLLIMGMPWLPWLLLIRTVGLVFAKDRGTPDVQLPEPTPEVPLPEPTTDPHPRPSLSRWSCFIVALTLLGLLLGRELAAESLYSLFLLLYLGTIRLICIPITVAGVLAARRTSHLMARRVLVLDLLLSTLSLALLALDDFVGPLGRLLSGITLSVLGSAYLLSVGIAFGAPVVKGAGSLITTAGSPPAAARSLALLPTLHARGYIWITREQCTELWDLSGESAFRLPPWDQLCSIPGFREGNISQLAKVAAAIDKRTRGARS